MWHYKGVIVRPETEIYYYLRGEKQARRRQGEKATLSSVLLELVKEGIELQRKGIGIIQNSVPEYKHQQRSNLPVNQCKAGTISDGDESYNIIEWIDDLEKLKYAEPEEELRDEINPSVQNVLLTDNGQAEVNNIVGDLVEGLLTQTQAPQVGEILEEKFVARQEEVTSYINKTPIGNRMRDCTTIQHKMAAFQIETTTQQQRLIWMLRDSDASLDDFFARTGISIHELLDVFLTNVDSVSENIMKKACNGFRQYNIQWMKEGSEYSPYNNLQTSKDNVIECKEPIGETSLASNKKKKPHCPLMDFDISILYANYGEAEPKVNEDDKSKETNNLLGDLVQGLLNHKQMEADLQKIMDEDDVHTTFKNEDTRENQEGKPPPSRQEDPQPGEEKKELTPVEKVLEKHRPALDGFMEMVRPFAESFMQELLEAYIIQYPEMAEPLKKMIKRYLELQAANNK